MSSAALPVLCACQHLVFFPKEPYNLLKRALHSYQKSLYSLCWAHVNALRSQLIRFACLLPQHYPQEPYILLKRALYSSQKSLIIFSKEPYILIKSALYSFQQAFNYDGKVNCMYTSMDELITIYVCVYTYICTHIYVYMERPFHNDYRMYIDSSKRPRFLPTELYIRSRCQYTE